MAFKITDLAGEVEDLPTLHEIDLMLASLADLPVEPGLVDIRDRLLECRTLVAAQQAALTR